MSENYYVILGIPSDSSLSDIKSAFRRLAKEFHPDYFGTSNSPFSAIQEAYSVLSDPKQRKQYDDSLKTERLHGIRKCSAKTYQSVHDNDIEPLIPEGNRAEPLTGPSGSSGSARQPSEPGFSLFNRFFNTVSENRNYGRNQGKYREIVITLSQEQAQRGGHVRIQLPARIRCPVCRGLGGAGFHTCRRCFGYGYLKTEIPLALNYPAHVAGNHTVQFPLDRYGMNDLTLIVRFTVKDSASLRNSTTQR